MPRSVQKVGVQIIETITVFDGTGVEVTGLVDGDFTKFLHKNGVVSGVSVVVTAIGSGEYKVAFTPDAAGAWRLRIEQSSGAGYNKRGWQATYDVSVGGVLSAADIWALIAETGPGGTFSVLRLLRIIASILAGKSTGGLANVTARDLADTQNMVVGTADSVGNRTPSSYGT